MLTVCIDCTCMCCVQLWYVCVYVRKHCLCGCCMCVPMYVTCQVVYAVCVFYVLYVHYTVYVCCTCLYVCTRVCKVVSKLSLSSADLET